MDASHSARSHSPRGDPARRALPLALIVALIVALAVTHGMILSPLYDFVSYFVSVFCRRTIFYHPVVLEQLPSVLIALLTLMIAGVPAAIYERVRGLRQSTPGSIAIWLVATLLLTAPVISVALGLR